jgi:hypothetical protein
MRRRSLGFALLSSLLLVAVVIGPAQAARRTTSAQVFSCPFGWCATTSFFASWTVASYYSEGKYQWEFSRPEPTATVSGGRNCPTCETWYYGADLYFYNAAGTLVATLHNPPLGSCGMDAAGSPSDVNLSRCQSYYYAPFSATKMKVHWRVDVSNCCGWTVNSAFETTTGFIPVP